MAEREWLPWSTGAFARAAGTGRPVLLLVENVWCSACADFHAQVLHDAEVGAGIRTGFVAVRVDGDRLPHVQDRYIAGGWPTLAFLTPTGEVLWSAAAPERPVLLGAMRGVAHAWRERRAEFELEIARRRKAFESTRRDAAHAGLVRRDAARSVLLSLQTAFDARYGGFGDPPRFPPLDALELLLELGARGDADALDMATRTLDGMRAGELWDACDGGFFRYGLGADWTEPAFEKLLDVNAGLLRAYALGASITGRADWRDLCDAIIAWVDRALARTDGLWAPSQVADDAWHAAPADQRARLTAPAADDTTLTDRAAAWIAALADAGRALERADLQARAGAALDTLFDLVVRGDRVGHWHEDGQPVLDGLLVDPVALLRACLAVHAACADDTALERARHLAHTLERRFWSDSGGFDDHDLAEPLGAVRDTQKPFGTNMTAALALLRLARATGERGPRAMAEQTLALFSKVAPRHGVEAATFVMAVNAFFDPGTRVG